MENKIEFNSDRVSIKGPKVDNSYTVSFIVGEYQLKNIKDLITVIDKNLKVNVEILP